MAAGLVLFQLSADAWARRRPGRDKPKPFSEAIRMISNVTHRATRHPQAALEGATQKELTIDDGRLTVLQRPPVEEVYELVSSKESE
jgi:hypothetical protein